MATKFCIDLAPDAALDYIMNNADYIYFCTADIDTAGVPDYAKIIEQLGTGDGAAVINGIAVTSANFTKADGDVSGRKLTVDEFIDVAVTQTGDAQAIVIIDSGNTAVLYVVTTSIESVTASGTVTLPAWSFEFRDPA